MSDEQPKKYGLYLEWAWTTYEAVVCLELIANGDRWQRWEQHYTDTRGIVTERAGKAILKALRENGKEAQS